jgi:hypothetical protein
MDNKERRRKLKQAYELLCVSIEIANDVLNTMDENAPGSDYLQELLRELDERAADFSVYSMEDGPLS